MLEPISRLDESLAGGPSAENKHSVPRAPRHQTQNLPFSVSALGFGAQMPGMQFLLTVT